MAAPQHGGESPRAIAEEPDEDQLIDRIIGGDEAAFELLYERYFKRIYHFVHRRLGNRADTEETVQEVFINVFSSIGSYRREAPFAAWVLGLTRRTIASRFKRKRHPTVPLLQGEEVEPDPSMALMHREANPQEHYEAQERVEQLETQAQRLTPEQWQLFEMHHLQDRPIAELAVDLDKTPDAVKSNLYRARKVLLTR